jgi:hypothetical protein
MCLRNPLVVNLIHMMKVEICVEDKRAIELDNSSIPVRWEAVFGNEMLNDDLQACMRERGVA